ncbi:hypothetical protein BU16DRAFT_473323, partial [Lophium mytilinum]
SMAFFNIRHLIKMLLSTSSFIKKLYVSIMLFMDKLTELYYSLAWGSSIRSTSREFIKYPNSLLAFLSNFVYYTYSTNSCRYSIINKVYIG